LLLANQLLFGGKVDSRRAVADKFGEFVARLGKGVLYEAGGLVAVEPSLAIVVPLPVLRERCHFLGL
jgi:hypothetical protein